MLRPPHLFRISVGDWPSPPLCRSDAERGTNSGEPQEEVETSWFTESRIDVWFASWSTRTLHSTCGVPEIVTDHLSLCSTAINVEAPQCDSETIQEEKGSLGNRDSCQRTAYGKTSEGRWRSLHTSRTGAIFSFSRSVSFAGRSIPAQTFGSCLWRWRTAAGPRNADASRTSFTQYILRNGK